MCVCVCVCLCVLHTHMHYTYLGWRKGFPGGSAGKESACNVGDLSSIPGLGRFPWRREWLSTPDAGLENSTD